MEISKQCKYHGVLLKGGEGISFNRPKFWFFFWKLGEEENQNKLINK